MMRGVSALVNPLCLRASVAGNRRKLFDGGTPTLEFFVIREAAPLG